MPFCIQQIQHTWKTVFFDPSVALSAQEAIKNHYWDLVKIHCWSPAGAYISKDEI